jgi:hypothetical protein
MAWFVLESERIALCIMHPDQTTIHSHQWTFTVGNVGKMVVFLGLGDEIVTNFATVLEGRALGEKFHW